ncbi:MAG: RecB family exonuclease [Candidatus Nanopelagicales bacterium]
MSATETSSPGISVTTTSTPEQLASPERAVEQVAPPGLPAGIALSPSRASDFLTCPLLFRFRAIDRIPERPSSAAVRGTLVHAVLENLFDLPAAERTLAAAHQLLMPTWRGLLDDDPKLSFALDADAEFDADTPTDAPVASPSVLADWIAGAEPLLETYFSLEDPTRLEPAARELRIEMQLDEGPALRGIVDRLDVAPGDLLRVVDYKTGRSPGPGFEQKALFQMRFYALMLWRTRGVLPKRLQLMYLGDSQVLQYEPTEEELVGFERKLRALWEAITKVAERGEWAPKPSRLCDWCDHHSRCPAKGGTPPPLPSGLGGTEQAVT